VILDVVATNKDNYETGILKLVINVTATPNNASPINSVRLKIDNLNLVFFKKSLNVNSILDILALQNKIFVQMVSSLNPKTYT
jgi:hypothetical protein